MTIAQDCKKFAKSHGMKVNASAGAPMISREIGGGLFWIECFDTWAECHAFLKSAQSARENEGKRYPWMA